MHSVLIVIFQNDVFNVKDWQDGLRALLPNINISFGAPQNDTRTNAQHNPSQKNTSMSSFLCVPFGLGKCVAGI